MGPASGYASEALVTTLEQLRNRHRPQPVQLLFIGESPPASGRFFYHGDSGLYRAMREAFQAADPSIYYESFLAAFQALGCYLIDLCREPVDHLDPQSRRAACQAAEASLASTIARLRPLTIATIVRSIEANVLNAVARANWQGTMIHLPYPGRWSHFKDAFVEALVPAISELLRPASLAIPSKRRSSAKAEPRETGAPPSERKARRSL